MKKSILILWLLGCFGITLIAQSKIPGNVKRLNEQVEKLEQKLKKEIQANADLKIIRKIKLKLEDKKELLEKAIKANKELDAFQGNTMHFLDKKYQELVAEVGNQDAFSRFGEIYGGRVYTFEGYPFMDRSWLYIFADRPFLYDTATDAMKSFGIPRVEARAENDSLLMKGHLFLPDSSIRKHDYSILIDKQLIPQVFKPNVGNPLGKRPNNAGKTYTERMQSHFDELWSKHKVKVEGVLEAKNGFSGDYLQLNDWVIIK